MYFRDSIAVVHTSIIHASTIYGISVNRLTVFFVGLSLSDDEILASIAIFRAQKLRPALEDYEAIRNRLAS